MVINISQVTIIYQILHFIIRFGGGDHSPLRCPLNTSYVQSGSAKLKMRWGMLGGMLEIEPKTDATSAISLSYIPSPSNWILHQILLKN